MAITQPCACLQKGILWCPTYEAFRSFSCLFDSKTAVKIHLCGLPLQQTYTSTRCWKSNDKRMIIWWARGETLRTFFCLRGHCLENVRQLNTLTSTSLKMFGDPGHRSSNHQFVWSRHALKGHPSRREKSNAPSLANMGYATQKEAYQSNERSDMLKSS